jgi:Tfp pilus assembly PilM family ATPase
MSGFSFSLHDAAAPSAAVEILGNRVSGAVVEERDGRPVVSAHATELLPDQAVVPALNAANVRDRVAVAAALGRVLERLGRPKRIALVLADPVAKVSLVKLQQVPSRPQDLEQVIRWQVKKSAPFSIDDAQVGYVAGMRADDGQDFIVTLARRDVIAEYEDLCRAAGAHAGIVDISTFNVVNTAVSAAAVPAGDWLLVNVAPGWESIAILRGAQLIFFRSHSADGEGTLADVVHQTAMYYEDRLKGAGFARALLCGAAASAEADALRRSLAERLSTTVDVIDPTKAASLTDRIVASGALLDTLTPLVGVLLRAREAA